MCGVLAAALVNRVASVPVFSGTGNILVHTGGSVVGCLDEEMRWVLDGGCATFSAGPPGLWYSAWLAATSTDAGSQAMPALALSNLLHQLGLVIARELF